MSASRMKSNMASRILLGASALLLSSVVACGSDDEKPKLVPIEGDVMEFLKEVPGPRLEGVKVSILEHPERGVVTGPDAHFLLQAEEGRDLTLVAEHSSLRTTQTATFRPGPNGMNPFSIQVVSRALFTLLSTQVPLPPELDKYCAVASTAARFGGSLYVRLRQGMPGVQVTLDPPMPAENGPIYFNAEVRPDPSEPSTSIDGGIIFYRLPPGDYRMNASKDGQVFNTVNLKCRQGIVVNAGPPLGVLANVRSPDYSLGMSLPESPESAASNAMCETTARCVNERAGRENYPPTTLASCKAMFKNTWAFAEEPCATSSGVRDTARTFYSCRAQNCDIVLGDDDVCVSEEAAFRAAEDAYGRCLSQP